MAEDMYSFPLPEEFSLQANLTSDITIREPTSIEDIRIDVCLLTDIVRDLSQEVSRICCQDYHRHAFADKLDAAMHKLKDAREILQDAAIELTAAIYQQAIDPQLHILE